MATFLSPAKINLFLQVCGLRPDGYHELASLFQAIDLCDTLHIELSDKDLWSCDDLALPMDKSNLVVKAIELFRMKSSRSEPVRVHLEKKIPQQAGLGGGSGNAATILWALNTLYRTGYPAELLASWSAQIGSDIPFFFSYGTALCRGRGEIVRNLPALPSQDVYIVKSLAGLSTPSVFKAIDYSKLTEADPDELVRGFYSKAPMYFNDLEAPAFTLMPELRVQRQQLSSSYNVVRLCGSGSALFCLDAKKGGAFLSSLPSSHSYSFLRRSCTGWY